MPETGNVNELATLARHSLPELCDATLEYFTQNDELMLMAVAGIARARYEVAAESARNPARARAENFGWWQLAFGAEIAARMVRLPKEPESATITPVTHY